MMNKFFLFSDLDRTLLPNGPQPESKSARPLLRLLANRSDFFLVYVTGRNKLLLKEAIELYDLPLPDYAIGDVGTTIYEPSHGWVSWEDWEDEIGKSWNQKNWNDLAKSLSDLSMIRLQEPGQQNTFKLSYYTETTIDIDFLEMEINRRLSQEDVRTCILYSVDENKHRGLVDVVPEKAGKLNAIRFLLGKKNIGEEQVVFAGDSGNDLTVLTSGIQSVLVKNASPNVRDQAVQRVAEKGIREKLYTAKGGFMGMNGYYSAGVLEGLAHFLPETAELMEDAIWKITGGRERLPSVH